MLKCKSLCIRIFRYTFSNAHMHTYTPASPPKDSSKAEQRHTCGQFPIVLIPVSAGFTCINMLWYMFDSLKALSEEYTRQFVASSNSGRGIFISFCFIKIVTLTLTKQLKKKMNFGRWNIKHLAICGAVLLALLVVMTNKPMKFESDLMIYNVKPVEVWEYMSDFNKIRTLNPAV